MVWYHFNPEMMVVDLVISAPTFYSDDSSSNPSNQLIC